VAVAVQRTTHRFPAAFPSRLSATVSRDDPLVHDFERHVHANLADPLRIDAVARTLATTRRTLERPATATLNAALAAPAIPPQRISAGVAVFKARS
jgi:transcriptional regulator GlxA family with amidase domain